MIRIAKTENGLVKGIEGADPRITAFKGIPFAAPPVGKNRWRAPQPAENWEGIREAYRFAPISMQSTPGLGTDVYCREWHVDPEIPMDEDCLYLNVWTSAKDTEEGQPVLVWFFGGGLQWGYPSEMEFDGERIARRGVVVVTVNYRLNAFGFLSHPEITAEAPEAPTNFGNLDQQAGLRWVSRNIAAFGGDSDNITIAGQSAGAGSVLTQMTCPDNFGLFHKAVVMSGMIRSPYGEDCVGIPKPLSEAEKVGERFFEYLGVQSLEEARQLDAKFIRDRYDEFMWKDEMLVTVKDDNICVGDPIHLFAEGKYGDVPVMAGNTSDEFPNLIRVKDKKELEERAKELFGERAGEFLQFPQSQEKMDEGFAPVSGIECTVKSSFLLNQESEHPNNCYYYRFAPDIPGEDNPGTFHSVDLWFFFETLAKCWRPFVGRHYDLSRQMCNYWANFIKTGNPNGMDTDGTPMPQWDSYEKTKRAEMVFSPEGAYAQTGCESDFVQFLIEEIRGQIEKSLMEADDEGN
ncbi:MAG: carboxylesterase family protein [Eubacterium sp.]|nr:carboxylesterase family protein [Eubacterium sp.]MDD5993411.1 carboxylesterase family protein [Clostridiales bacterium]